MLPKKNKMKLDKAIKKWRTGIKKRGVITLKLRSAIQGAGYEKRGAKNFNLIKEYISRKGLYLTAALNKCKRLEETRLDDFIHIYPYPAGPKGGLFEKEDDLQAAFKKGYPHLKLGLTGTIREEYKPSGSTKRLDILCEGRDGREVVVELKNSDGERRAVEQLLAYIGDIKREKATAEVRGILITGTVDPDTLHAIFGLDKENLITWFQYWKTEKGSLKFEEITKATVKDFIEKIEGFAA